MDCKSVQSSMYFGAKSPQQLAKKAMRKNGVKLMDEQGEKMRQSVERELRKMKKAEQKFKNNRFEGWDECERLHDLCCYG